MQKRGFDRVLSILDACEELLQTRHFEDIGTADIAAKARLKIGTLYFFFYDRAAIFTCLVQRVLTEIQEQFAAEPVGAGIGPEQYVGVVLTRLSAVWSRHRSLMNLYHSFQHKAEIKANRDALQHFATKRLVILLRDGTAGVDARRARASAWVLYDMLMSSLDSVVHLAEGERPEVAREWRRAISTYISSLQRN